MTVTAFALTAPAPYVAAQNTDSSAYWKDSRGEIVRNAFNLCWRAGYWTPAMAICECDPDIAQACTPPAPKAVVVPPPFAPVALAPVPAAPAPPAPAPRAVTPVRQKVTLKADTLFDFDKAVIRPEGRRELDDLIEKLKMIDVETIIDIGHADRFGSASTIKSFPCGAPNR